MRRFWTGMTDKAAPRAAPAVWPMPYHQSVYEVDWDENRTERRKATQALRNDAV
jgi:hypothetical protein